MEISSELIGQLAGVRVGHDGGDEEGHGLLDVTRPEGPHGTARRPRSGRGHAAVEPEIEQGADEDEPFDERRGR